MKRTSDEKLFAGLSYLLGGLCCMIPSIVIFFLKKDESPYVKYHSLQSIAVWVILLVVSIVLSIISTVVQVALAQIPLLGMLAGIPGMLFGLACLIYFIYLAVQTFMGNDVDVPVIGDFINEKFM
jgi:uncharacterized membrane protein